MLSSRETLAFKLLHQVHARYDSAGINARRSDISICTEAIFALQVDEGLEWEKPDTHKLFEEAKKLKPLTTGTPFLPFAEDDFGWLYQISNRDLIMLILIRLKKLYVLDQRKPGDLHWSTYWFRWIMAACKAIGVPRGYPELNEYTLERAAIERAENRGRLELDMRDLQEWWEMEKKWRKERKDKYA